MQIFCCNIYSILLLVIECIKARKQLAAIDWNFHANLPNAKSKSDDNTKVQPKDQAVGYKANQSQQGI